ncbi:hypothetical protein MPH_10311 [Macrophomina phaseolina MS6]|uniref:Uncharacterized protein n=1 Tax=Macrophomina phaseolina (strain MS6) TaxID=1126212 RepID=K2QRT5_MACPH|nr:hypothetical protein MPH_10311 [Macrophomina phaseolina MS6]
MAFRERVKRVLGRNSSSKSSSSSSLSKKPSKSAEDENHRYYLPGEKMPPMKYRRPVAKEHKEKLEAFNFEKAWRRRSQQSVYSPMGSRIPSRRNSLTSRKSMNVPRSQVVEDLDQAGNTANGTSRSSSESTTGS